MTLFYTYPSIFLDLFKCLYEEFEVMSYIFSQRKHCTPAQKTLTMVFAMDSFATTKVVVLLLAAGIFSTIADHVSDSKGDNRNDSINQLHV